MSVRTKGNHLDSDEYEFAIINDFLLNYLYIYPSPQISKSRSMGCGLPSVPLPVDLHGESDVHSGEAGSCQSVDDRKNETAQRISNNDECVLNHNREGSLGSIEELDGFRKLLILALTKQSLRICFPNKFGEGNISESVLIKVQDDMIERLGGVDQFLVTALADDSSKFVEAQVQALSRYVSLSDPFVPHHIQSVSSNLCHLITRFKWLQREEDTYSPQFDWIQARLIYDFLTENVTKKEVIIQLPVSNRNMFGGKIHGIGVRCNGRAILSQLVRESGETRIGSLGPTNQPYTVNAEMRNANGITDGMNIWIDGEDTFKNTSRVPQLTEINKYDYLLWEGFRKNHQYVNNAEIKLTYPAIDDAMYLFVDPSTFWRKWMEDKGWIKVGIIITERGNPVNVWECPLKCLIHNS